MSFQNINFKATNTEVPLELRELVAQKFDSLNKFIGTDPFICDVEFERVTHHQSGNVCRMEANLEVNGKLYRAEATLDSFEKAVDAVRDDLERELRKENNKRETLFKRGSRRLKEMLRFG